MQEFNKAYSTQNHMMSSYQFIKTQEDIGEKYWGTLTDHFRRTMNILIHLLTFRHPTTLGHSSLKVEQHQLQIYAGGFLIVNKSYEKTKTIKRFI